MTKHSDYEQSRPFQEDGHLAVPTQEPRTGGVLVRWDGGYGMFVPNSYGTQTHRVFPLAEADALLAVVEKAREFLTGIDEGRIDTLALRNAVEALGCLTKGDG